MKNGFTLIELIGVIIVLALLTLIIVPNVVTNLREGISSSKDFQNESIILGAKNWASDNRDKLPLDGQSEKYPISMFQEDGYIEKSLKDPETGEEIDPNSICVFISNNSKKFTYEVKECG